jgi:phage terminase small subunit
MSKPMRWDGLSEKRRLFVEAYSSNGGNAVQAATVAGYKCPDSEGARLLGNC